MKSWLGSVIGMLAAFLLITQGSDVLMRTFFGGGAGERTLYMKLPLDPVSPSRIAPAA